MAYQSDREVIKTTATIFLEANYHYTNVVDNADFAHVPIVMPTATEGAEHPRRHIAFHLPRGTPECNVRPGYQQAKAKPQDNNPRDGGGDTPRVRLHKDTSSASQLLGRSGRVLGNLCQRPA